MCVTWSWGDLGQRADWFRVGELKEVVELVGLHFKGVLKGKLFAASSNYLTLGGVILPQVCKALRCQSVIKYRKFKNHD